MSAFHPQPQVWPPWFWYLWPLGRTFGATLYPGAGLLQRETYTQVMAVRGVVFNIASGKEFYGRDFPTVP